MTTDPEYAARLRRIGHDFLSLDDMDHAALERAIELLEQQDDPMLWAAQNEPE